MAFFNENALIKTPHKKEVMTSEQMQEFVRCADPDTGPMYFLTHFYYIQHPTRGKLLYQPYPFQIKLIDSYHHNRFSISLLSRQTGKCFGYETMVTINSNDINDDIQQIQIGDLLWKEMTFKQKMVTKLENWLIKLVKSVE